MKKTEKKTEQSRYLSDTRQNVKTAAESESVTTSVQMVFEKDNEQAAYQVQLWPKGKFTFSAANGFEGEADRVLIIGQMQKTHDSAELLTTEQQHKQKLEAEIKERKTIEELEKKEIKSSSTDFRWVIGGLILLIFGGIWIYRRFVSA